MISWGTTGDCTTLDINWGLSLLLRRSHNQLPSSVRTSRSFFSIAFGLEAWKGSCSNDLNQKVKYQMHQCKMENAICKMGCAILHSSFGMSSDFSNNTRPELPFSFLKALGQLTSQQSPKPVAHQSDGHDDQGKDHHHRLEFLIRIGLWPLFFIILTLRSWKGRCKSEQPHNGCRFLDLLCFFGFLFWILCFLPSTLHFWLRNHVHLILEILEPFWSYRLRADVRSHLSANHLLNGPHSLSDWVSGCCST